METNSSEFKPIGLPEKPDQPRYGEHGPTLTISTTIRGAAVEKFKQMVEENNLNRSLLLKQMVFHCLGDKEALEQLKTYILANLR